MSEEGKKEESEEKGSVCMSADRPRSCFYF